MTSSTIRAVLNSMRNLVVLRVRYPWVRFGRDVHTHWSTRLMAPSRHVVLGDSVGIGPHGLVLADLEIGNKVLIASYVAFLNSVEHRYDVPGRTMWDSGRGEPQKIVVEGDVWIGHGAILLAPLRVGRGSVVAAGCVVTKDVPRYSIVAGVPARVVSHRFNRQQIEDHESQLIGQGEMSRDDRTEF